MELYIIGATQWCAPCVRYKDAISPVAFKNGVNVTFYDLGKRGIETEKNLQEFRQMGFTQLGGSIPAFFNKNKKRIKAPTNLKPESILDWLNEFIVEDEAEGI